jgi:preprotein translocase subunit Sec61beta
MTGNIGLIDMAEREKNYMPQSTAGLIRYFDEESGIRIKPEHVIIMSVAMTAFVVILRLLM